MESQKIENWLSRVGTVTATNYRFTMTRWLTWMAENGGKFKNFSPDDFIRHQQKCDNGNCYEILDYIQRWILSHKDHSFRTKHAYLQALLSFFSHNRAPLPSDKSFKMRGDKPKTVSRLTEEQVKDVVLIQGPMYQGVYMVMASSGMGCAELVEWSNTGYEELRSQLLEGQTIIKISLPGRKSNRNETPYYCLLGGDGLRALKQYMGDELPRNRDAVFINPLGRPLGTLALKHQWMRTLKRLKIVTAKKGNGTGVRYGYGIHNLRDLWRTNWSRARSASDVGEFLMGHQIDPLGYNQIYRDEEYVKEQYRQALKYLNYLSHSVDLTDSTADELLERARTQENKVLELERQNRELKEKIGGLRELKNDMAMMKKFMIDFSDIKDFAEYKRLEKLSDTNMTDEDLAIEVINSPLTKDGAEQREKWRAWRNSPEYKELKAQLETLPK